MIFSHSSVDLSAPAASGSSPKHTIYTFIINSQICHVKRTKLNKKRPGLAHFKNEMLVNSSATTISY